MLLTPPRTARRSTHRIVVDALVIIATFAASIAISVGLLAAGIAAVTPGGWSAFHVAWVAVLIAEAMFAFVLFLNSTDALFL